MFNSNLKNYALQMHEQEVERYNEAVDELNKTGEHLYNVRKVSLKAIQEIETLINSIAHSPKSFGAALTEMRTAAQKFRDTSNLAKESMDAAINSGIGAAAGVAGGAAVASLAPTAAMWVATTFGTASTGTAISALSGAAATNAALAWLGGGALAAGGGGMAAGQALLALAGPIGWGIAGASLGLSILALSSKNQRIADEASVETKRLKRLTASLQQTIARIRQIDDMTVRMVKSLGERYEELRYLNGADYQALPYDTQEALGVFVNNTASMAALLNRTVE